VAVDDIQSVTVIVGQLMSCVQAAARLGDDLGGKPSVESLWEGALDARARLQQAGKALALHPLHGEVQDSVFLAEVEDLTDVRMMYSGRHTRLVEEHALERLVLGQVGQDRLDCHDLAEAALAVLLRRPHARHTALGHCEKYLVAS